MRDGDLPGGSRAERTTRVQPARGRNRGLGLGRSRPAGSGSVAARGEAEARELVARLRAATGSAVVRTAGGTAPVVDHSARRRAEYSSDASNYRVTPEVVVLPRDVDEVLAVAAVCRETGTALTVRGAGTSIAGNAVGPGVVMDLSRHLTGTPDIDPDSRTAKVAPGLVLDDLQAAARPHRLRFGPDPSTHGRATLGGMIGNNACGARAVAYGRTADNVVALDVVDGTGRRFAATAAATGTPPSGNGSPAGPVVPGLDTFVHANLGVIRTELGRFDRQISGYSLEHLLPERGAHLGRALVGTEGTCAVVLGATVRLVEIPTATALAVLGYPDMATAADAVPGLLGHRPLAVEGMDARLVDGVRRRRGSGAVPALPDGGGWLFVEVGGPTGSDAAVAAAAVVADAGAGASMVLPAGPVAAALWRLREDGAGLAGRTPDGAPAWPGWEDAAVPPANLGSYLREFGKLMRAHQLDGVAYGHFGDGCVHVRIDFPLAEHPGRLRTFLTEAAHLVVAHGGSLTGEHGDGRARGELLPIMYSPDALAAFAAFKHIFDPDDLMNPGVVVRPRPLDADLRRPRARPLPRVEGSFALTADAGDLTQAVHRCVGLAKCRADTSTSGGFMCPSFLATRDEKDSTRGRARVLQELAAGGPGGPAGPGGAPAIPAPARREWRDPAVRESLDLCLSCRACARDCPAGVDVARYKSEVLHRAYRRRPRPAAHYALGWLPRWTRLAGRVPRVVNAALRTGAIRRPLFRLGGLDARRAAPEFAAEPFHRWWRRTSRNAPAATGDRTDPPVLLWVDTFTDVFAPGAARAAVEVLTAAGHRVLIPSGRPACCGLTWITTGQLDGARRRLRRTLDQLAPYALSGIPIVGLEPSCTAVLRDDLVELFPGDRRAEALAAGVRTLAELLTQDGGPEQRPARSPAGGGNPAGGRNPAGGWRLPRLDGVRVLAQPHCHQHAVMGFETDSALLRAAGAEVETLAGCCGLAGDFGMRRGHHDISVAVAERALLPALRAAGEDTVLLADGFSCRTQAAQLGGRTAYHLAELLAKKLRPG
ncbi:D-lactate dehydrogenase (cytochrome) [Parafrankia sp. EAN1pec]|uniref:FAD-binding and (Fe-S)-binding domain-containing protein n=1 Tax=Parafrankia sp. (strain EAN1pec) TaxID=298653 RepID=UPI0000542CF1|nr:D-lactate dehydrogenase (cytochrome) [Frankia sp. EAN1pec]